MIAIAGNCDCTATCCVCSPQRGYGAPTVIYFLPRQWRALTSASSDYWHRPEPLKPDFHAERRQASQVGNNPEGWGFRPTQDRGPCTRAPPRTRRIPVRPGQKALAQRLQRGYQDDNIHH
jgi:hypothetical protein